MLAEIATAIGILGVVLRGIAVYRRRLLRHSTEDALVRYLVTELTTPDSDGLSEQQIDGALRRAIRDARIGPAWLRNRWPKLCLDRWDYNEPGLFDRLADVRAHGVDRAKSEAAYWLATADDDGANLAPRLSVSEEEGAESARTIELDQNHEYRRAQQRHRRAGEREGGTWRQSGAAVGLRIRRFRGASGRRCAVALAPN